MKESININYKLFIKDKLQYQVQHFVDCKKNNPYGHVHVKVIIAKKHFKGRDCMGYKHITINERCYIVEYLK